MAFEIACCAGFLVWNVTQRDWGWATFFGVLLAFNLHRWWLAQQK